MVSSSFPERYWSLHDVTVVSKSPLGGTPRLVHHITSNEGDFILKAADESKGAAAVERDISIFEFLERHQFPAQKLLLTKTGKPFIENDGRYWYMLSYVEGEHPTRTPDNFRQLGELTAQLHSLEDYTIQTSFTFAKEMELMRERAIAQHAPEKYLQLVNQLPDLSTFPTALIHTDIGMNNAIQDHSGQIYFIDWDDAGIGTRILDICFPLICGFLSEDLHFEADNARAFYQGYLTHANLTDEERAHLFDAALFYVLMYTMDDKDFLKKALWAVEHRAEIEKVLPK